MLDAHAQEPVAQVVAQSVQTPLAPHAVSEVPSAHVLVAASQQPPWHGWVEEQAVVQVPLVVSQALSTGHSADDLHPVSGDPPASPGLSDEPLSWPDESAPVSVIIGPSTAPSADPVSCAPASPPSSVPFTERRPPQPARNGAATTPIHLSRSRFMTAFRRDAAPEPLV